MGCVVIDINLTLITKIIITTIIILITILKVTAWMTLAQKKKKKTIFGCLI